MFTFIIVITLVKKCSLDYGICYARADQYTGVVIYKKRLIYCVYQRILKIKPKKLQTGLSCIQSSVYFRSSCRIAEFQSCRILELTYVIPVLVASMDWYVSVICTRHGMSNSPASPCPSCGQDSGSDSKVAGDQAETTVSGPDNQVK